MKDISVQITKLTGCKLKLKVTVEKPLVEKIYQTCCTEVQKNVQLPGFRKGTVPLNLIKARFPSLISQQFVEKLISETLPQVLKENNINYLPDSLQVYSTNFAYDNACSYEINLETEPDVKLSSYKGLKLKKEVRKVTQSDIDKTLQQLRENNAILVVSPQTEITQEDITSKSLTYCVVNYKIFIDGKEIKKYEGKNVLINLAENNLPKGFKEGLVGMKRGDKKAIQVEFPVNLPYIELMGKQGLMEVELLEIKQKQIPELDDNFAKNLGYKNVDELIQDVKQQLQHEFDTESQKKLKDQIYEQLLKTHDFPLPESEVESNYQKKLELLKQDFLARGGKEENFKLTPEQEKKLKEKSINEVKLKYILKKIIEKEKIEVTKEEIEKEKGKLFTLYPGKEKEINEYFEKNLDIIVSNILEEKVVNFIISQTKIKEVDVTPV